MNLYICPYEGCLYSDLTETSSNTQSLVVIKDIGNSILEHGSLNAISNESLSYLTEWFLNNSNPYIPALTPSTSPLLLSGDRIIVLGITRATIPQLTFLKRTSQNELVDYIWVDAFYADYISRVYSLPATEAIIVIRPKKDLFWTDKGKDTVEVWVNKIVNGDLSGRSSVGFVLRVWKSGVGVGEDVYEWTSESIGLRNISIFVFVVGAFWFFLRAKQGTVSTVKAD